MKNEQGNKIQQALNLLNHKTDDEIQEIMDNAKSFFLYYQCAIMEIETKFRVLDKQFSLHHERNPIESIQTRLKSLESIEEKLTVKGLPVNLESVESNLKDVAGVRVICSFIDDIYLLADCLLQQDDVELVELKDYIKNPKPNGYMSLHLIVRTPIFLSTGKRYVKVEVQLRTIAMEMWARLEHRLRYKKNLDENLLEKTSDELLECAKLSHSLDEKMQKIRNAIEK